jgi:hypothetical protein
MPEYRKPVISKPEMCSREEFEIQRERSRSSQEKIPENRHRLNCSMSAPWSKIPSRTKGQDERSTSALIEALTSKEKLTIKIPEEVISPLFKDKSSQRSFIK